MEIINNQLLISGNVIYDLPRIAQDAKVKAWKVPAEYRENGFFVSIVMPEQAEEVPACDMAATEFIGELDLEADVDEVLQSKKASKLKEINNSFEVQSANLLSDYPDNEIKSWPQQVKEAEALLLNSDANVPLLNAIANQRGITATELANRVMANMSAFSIASGALIGRRQAAEGMINNASAIADLELITF